LRYVFGNKKGAAKVVDPKIRNAPEPALPPKQVEIDRRLIKESSPIITEKSDPKTADKDQKSRLLFKCRDKQRYIHVEAGESLPDSKRYKSQSGLIDLF
jgi:hypothetical protein